MPSRVPPKTPVELNPQMPTESAEDEEPLFKVSTVLAPPKTFEIDGESYTLFDIRHFDPKMEATYRLLVKEERKIQRSIDSSIEDEDNNEAMKQSLLCREIRLRMIKLCTDVPDGVARKLNFFASGKICNAVILAAADVPASAMKRAMDATPEVT